MGMDVRRVVTGHDASGRAVFASDERVAGLTMAALRGSEFHRLWGADEAPTFPDDGSPPEHETYFPSVGGFRFGLFTLPPAGTPAPSGEPDLAEVEAKLPGLLAHMEPEDPGMHTTDTIDFEVVLSGEVVLELDDGAATTLRPGDTVVQNGTRHRWRNEGAEPAMLAVFIVGARRRG
jgi:mannose-6-phosphate isomerase-like protein (cupin superfamily)